MVFPPLTWVLLVVAAALCAAIILHASSAAPLLLGIVAAIGLLLWWATCATASDLSLLAIRRINNRQPRSPLRIDGALATALHNPYRRSIR